MNKQWKTTFSKTGFPTRELWAHDEIGREHIATFTTNQEDNAAFIVTACNSHDELVEALQSLVKTLDNCIECGLTRNPEDFQHMITLNVARNTLAKVRGES